MENLPPPAQELAILDHELVQLEARRSQLLARRAWLLTIVQQPALDRTAGRAWAAPPPVRSSPPAETTAPGAQNVLLTLGGVLLTIAAIAFTVVSWGHLGIAGRAAVLGAVTAAAAAAPMALLRRGLASTAESVAGVGLALTVLDAYALHQVAARGTGGLAFAAGSSAVLALLWALYGAVMGRRLRLPVPAAVVAAQLPLLLWAAAAGAGPLTTSSALLVTAAGDTAVLLWHKSLVTPPPRKRGGFSLDPERSHDGQALTAAEADPQRTAPPRGDEHQDAFPSPAEAGNTHARSEMVRTVAGAGACVTGAAALLTAGRLSASAGTAGGAAVPGVLLLAGAVVALFAARRVTSAGPAEVAGLAAVAAVTGVARHAVADAWSPVVVLFSAYALPAVLGTGAARHVVRGLVAVCCGIQAAVAVWALPAAAFAVLAPAARVTDVWTGPPRSLGVAWPGLPAAPVALLLIASFLAVVHRRPAGPAARWRTESACGAITLACAAACLVPAAATLTYPAALTWYATLTAVGLAAAARLSHLAGGAGAPAATALGCALAAAFTVSSAALATEPATLGVSAALLVLFAAAATVPGTGPVRTITACAAVLYATALACATGAALELPVHRTALLVLVVPAAAAVLAAGLRRRHPALPVEITAAVAALLAVVLTAGDARTLSLVLALCGVIVAGTAVRPERRAVGHAAPVLFVLATWVALAASGISVPEAYTLPAAVPALAVGLLRRRRDPSASSWIAYGPGLAVGLLPSLFAAWGDAHGPRPLLLGAAALAVTLTGARLRLQALLALGGAVLALDAAHELAPYVVQVIGVLPRWLPPALAGLLLLSVGATYEQRLRDARRLRDRLARMH